MWVERRTRQCAGKLQFSLDICTVVAGEADDKKESYACLWIQSLGSICSVRMALQH